MLPFPMQGCHFSDNGFFFYSRDPPRQSAASSSVTQQPPTLPPRDPNRSEFASEERVEPEEEIQAGDVHHWEDPFGHCGSLDEA